MAEQVFHANAVDIGIDEATELFSVFLADLDDHDELRYYLLLREDELKDGKSLYAEFNDAANSCLNGIILMFLDDSALRLRFESDAGIRRSEIGNLSTETLEEMQVHFDVSDTKLAELDHGLRYLSEDTCRYRDNGTKRSNPRWIRGHASVHHGRRSRRDRE